MEENNFGVALAVLRLIRGWNQDELARHSGVRNSSVSDYERGKIVPGAGTLDRLLAAMGYSFSALDGTRTLIGSLRADQALREAARLVRGEGEERAGTARSESELREIEQASLEAGRAAARLTRVFLSLVKSGPEPDEPRSLPDASE